MVCFVYFILEMSVIHKVSVGCERANDFLRGPFINNQVLFCDGIFKGVRF